MLKLKIGLFSFLFACLPLTILAQETQVKGKVVELNDQNPLPNILISIEKVNISVETDASGEFVLKGSQLPFGPQVLTLSSEDYQNKRYPITINEGEILELGILELESLIDKDLGIAKIALSEDKFDSDM